MLTFSYVLLVFCALLIIFSIVFTSYNVSEGDTIPSLFGFACCLCFIACTVYIGMNMDLMNTKEYAQMELTLKQKEYDAIMQEAEK